MSVQLLDSIQHTRHTAQVPPSLLPHPPPPTATQAKLELDPAADRIHCLGFALRIFDNADRVDRAGKATERTSKAFYAASVFIEVGGRVCLRERVIWGCLFVRCVRVMCARETVWRCVLGGGVSLLQSQVNQACGGLVVANDLRPSGKVGAGWSRGGE